jgi:hypothetical protein
MVLYECKLCNFKSKLKTDYTRHKKTKKHEANILLQKEELEGMAPLCKIGAKMSQNEPKMSQNEPKRAKQVFLCEYCDKEFSTKANKRKHELHRCKHMPLINNYYKDKNEWKKEKNKLYSQIDALIKKAGNTTTNNLNLNSYGNEDLSHITDQFKTNLLKGPYGMIKKMIEEVHFSDKKPENKNLAITNKKENKIKIFKNGSWEFCKKTEIVNDIIHNNYYLLDSHYDDMDKELLNEIQKHQYSNFKNDFGNGELDKDTKEDVEILILNNE